MDWERRLRDVAKNGGWHIVYDEDDFKMKTWRDLLLLAAYLMFENSSVTTITLINRIIFEIRMALEARNNSTRKDGKRVDIAAARHAILSAQSQQSHVDMIFQEFTERAPAAPKPSFSSPTSSKPAKRKQTCNRCGRTSHFVAQCTATTHADGQTVLQPKSSFRAGGGAMTSGAAAPAPKATSQQH